MLMHSIIELHVKDLKLELILKDSSINVYPIFDFRKETIMFASP